MNTKALKIILDDFTECRGGDIYIQYLESCDSIIQKLNSKEILSKHAARYILKMSLLDPIKQNPLFCKTIIIAAELCLYWNDKNLWNDFKLNLEYLSKKINQIYL